MFTFPYNVLIGGAVLVAIGVGAWKIVDTYNDAIEDRIVAEKEAKDSKEALEESQLQVSKLREMGLLADELGRKRKQELQHEQKKSTDLFNALAEAKKKDPTLEAWMDSPVHPTVRSMRRAALGPVRPSGEVHNTNGSTVGNP